MPQFIRSLLLFLAFAGIACAVVGPGTVTGNTAVADPTICKDNSGTYYVFCMISLLRKIFPLTTPSQSHCSGDRNSNLARPYSLDLDWDGIP